MAFYGKINIRLSTFTSKSFLTIALLLARNIVCILFRKELALICLEAQNLKLIGLHST
jgi:hypothetical protein